jgi:hypothetical protein
MSEGKRKHRDISTADQLKRARKAYPVTTRRVPSDGMDTAKRLAEGDERRIEVQPDQTVVVRNQPRKDQP